MTDWARHILQVLLDKYEDSAAFQRDEPTARPIQVRLTDALVPKYKSGGMDPDERRALHATLGAWANERIVCLDWVRFEEGNLLARVVLVWDGVQAAYDTLERTPKTDTLAALQADIAARAQRMPLAWVRHYLATVSAYIDERRSVPENLLPSAADKRALLLEALAGLADKGDESLPMRVFSKRYLKSSKAFEQHVRSRFVSVLRQFYAPSLQPAQPGAGAGPGSVPVADVLGFEDEALLAEVGIEVSHEDVCFCGPLVLRLAGTAPEMDCASAADGAGEIDCTLFPFGLALDADGLRQTEFLASEFIVRVLSIENKANYRHYVRHQRQTGELVVYLGGFPGPAKRRFLGRLWAALAPRGTRFQHWGDLDYGGILIAQLLQDTAWPTLQPWRMEPTWVDEYGAYVEPYGDSYRRRLEGLRQNPRYAAWHSLLDKLLTVGGTLEQEAFLV